MVIDEIFYIEKVVVLMMMFGEEVVVMIFKNFELCEVQYFGVVMYDVGSVDNEIFDDIIEEFLIVL